MSQAWSARTFLTLHHMSSLALAIAGPAAFVIATGSATVVPSCRNELLGRSGSTRARSRSANPRDMSYARAGTG